MQQMMQDKDVALVILSEEKRIAGEYCTAITEANCPTIRRTLTQLLTDTLQCQEILYNTMKQLGWYQGETLAPSVDISSAQQTAQFTLTETQNSLQQMGLQTPIQSPAMHWTNQYSQPMQMQTMPQRQPIPSHMQQQASQWMQPQQRPASSTNWQQANSAWPTQPQSTSQQSAPFRTQGIQQQNQYAAMSAQNQPNAQLSASFGSMKQPALQQNAQTQATQAAQTSPAAHPTANTSNYSISANTARTSNTTSAAGSNFSGSHIQATNRSTQPYTGSNSQRTTGVVSPSSAIHSPQTAMSAAFAEAEQSAERTSHNHQNSHSSQSAQTSDTHQWKSSNSQSDSSRLH